MRRNKIIYPFIIIFLVLTIAGCTTGQGNSVIDTGIITGSVNIDENLTITENHLAYTASKSVSTASYNIQTVSVDTSEIIIEINKKMKPGQFKTEILKGKGKIVKKIGDYTYKVKLGSDKTESIINKLRSNSLVSCIEYDYPLYIQNIPNDPHYPLQWNLEMLGIEEVWDKYKGNQDTIVAVIDTGILPDHPDLKNNIVAGYDFIDNDSDPTDTSQYFSHGTHVAGIIGAVTNNSTGVAGINWQIKIMPIRVIGPEGNGGYSNLIEGINWAVNHGARIINLSLAGSFYSESLKNTIKKAVDKGVTVIAAAGNNGSTPILYPARYPEVISVGAVGPEREIAYYSNYGPDLDLVAPGGNSSNNKYSNNTILSTAGYYNSYQQQVHQYTCAEGTSMATPHVSGVTALLYRSGITDPAAVKKRLKETALDLGTTGFDDKYGAGLINIRGALNIKNESETVNSPENNLNNNNLDLAQIKIFTCHQDREEIKQSSSITHPDNNGRFSLEVEKGNWSLIAWLDTDNNNKLDTGDYYAKKENINIQSGKTNAGMNLTLGKLK